MNIFGDVEPTPLELVQNEPWMQVKAKYDIKTFTFGIDAEVNDVDKSGPLPEGWSWSYSESECGNRDGKASWPLKDQYEGDLPISNRGGEVNTAVYNSPEELGDAWDQMIAMQEAHIGHEISVSGRSGGHVHVGVEGLTEDRDGMKRLFWWATNNWVDITKTNPPAFNIDKETCDPKLFKYMMGACCSVLRDANLERALAADTARGVIDGQANQTKDNKPSWMMQRPGLNTTRLRGKGGKHPTIENRSNWGTRQGKQMANVALFTAMCIETALNEPHKTIHDVIAMRDDWDFPPMPHNDQVMEDNFRKYNYANGSEITKELLKEIKETYGWLR